MAPSRESIEIQSLQRNVFVDVGLYKPDGPEPYLVVVAGHKYVPRLDHSRL